jgi:hypothetical protein
MRANIKTSLGAVLLSIALQAPALEAAIMPGDINGDGSVDITDVMNLFIWLSSAEVDDICQNAADVNQDGRVDLSDAVYLLIHMYGSDDGIAAPLPEGFVKSCLDEQQAVVGLRDVRGIVLSPESAMITWLTAHPSSSIVRYGPTGALEHRVDVDESALYHQVLLEDLRPGSTYYFQVASVASGFGIEDSFIESFRTLEIEDYTIRRDHPRLFFTQEDIPELKRKISSSAYEDYWKMSEGYCRDKVGLTPAELAKLENLDDRIKAFAFVGLIGNVSSFRQKAIDAALYLSDNRNDDDLRQITQSIAFVYDWLHEYLESEVQAKLLKALVACCRDLDGKLRDNEYVTGMSHGHNKPLMLAALAFHGDHSYAEDLIERSVRDYRHGYLATWRRFCAGDGGSSKGWWYSMYVLPFELEFLAAWRSATGQDWYKDERVWCEPILDWFTYGLRGDMTFLREADGHVQKGITSDNRIFANMVAKEYGNPVAQWFGERAKELDVVWGPYGIREILWHDASVEPAAPSGPPSKVFRSAGTAIMRESWSRDAAIAHFRSGEVYTHGHSHRDSCTFTIFYKSSLAIDSGLYDALGSSHHDNYYSRTVAHNGITVFDPDEKFVKYGDEFSNDGGQRWLVPGEDVDSAWPATAEDTVDRSKGWRLGGILRYEDGDGYTYVVGDGTPAYSARKLNELNRHFLWLRSVEGWDHPVAIVFDDVVSRRASFRKAYLLHSETRPVIEDSRVTIVNGEGALFQYTLAPSEHEIKAIGGAGKEYWVDGANYPPSRSARDKEEPGTWRVEVSPSTERTDDRFLHALFIADAGESPPPQPQAFTAGSMQGCRVGEWVILLPTARDPVTEIEYESTRSASTHLICGVVPLAAYDLTSNEGYVGRVTASFSGTLKFTVAGPTRVFVRKAPE